MMLFRQGSGSFFEKKEPKKLLATWSRGVFTAWGKLHGRLLALA
jgi:hypothetical protein